MARTERVIIVADADAKIQISTTPSHRIGVFTDDFEVIKRSFEDE